MKSARKIVEEHFRGLCPPIKDKDLYEWYKDLIVTCMEEHTKERVRLVRKRQVPMPDLKSFRARREKLGLSLRDVASKTGVCPASISRIERSYDCSYKNVRTLNNYYLKHKA